MPFWKNWPGFWRLNKNRYSKKSSQLNLKPKIDDYASLSIKISLERTSENATATQELANWIILLDSAINLESISDNSHWFAHCIIIIFVSEQKNNK